MRAQRTNLFLVLMLILFLASDSSAKQKKYNDVYTGDRLNRIAFPLGGIGAGMICLEGTGALSHVSIRNKPEVFNEPMIFSAVCIKGKKNIARVLEGPLPAWKYFGLPRSGNGSTGKTYGLPRFADAAFRARFPFATIKLTDSKIPLQVVITAWSPFTPGDADNSSLPVAALEYRFINTTDKPLEAVYSFNSRNFLAVRDGRNKVLKTKNGFVLSQAGTKEKPWLQGALAACVETSDAKVNCAWFRGGWWDPVTMVWNDVKKGACYDKQPVTEGKPSPGGTIFVPINLPPGGEKTVKLMLAWYVPQSDMRLGKDPEAEQCCPADSSCAQKCSQTYVPWYAAKFGNIDEVGDYWRVNYAALRRSGERFSDCFYDSTLPAEVIEAIAANLTILKSPTVLRQTDGRLWCFEGCSDNSGCCHGSCTHVWNYAQAIPHLFPALERTLRQTEFNESQDEKGHQMFRSGLPIRPIFHQYHAASDGQLGGIMKVYRDWRISGDTQWLKQLWPDVKVSMNYCIQTWDPDHRGVLFEPHHNTYDIEFWGPDGMCGSFYLGALKAADKMAIAIGDDVPLYASLFQKGQKYINEHLFNGEYYYQKIQWTGLRTENPLEAKAALQERMNYSTEAVELFEKEGPKYQYGTGCLSDGVLGAWIAKVCGVGEILDTEKVAGHLRSVHKYNLKKDLSEHANPQRPAFALGKDGGLLLCSWPRGGKLSLPFVYSDEVWTGIEYQVASHLMMMGMVERGLEIVRVCRDRYDGRIRNPFNEYECGHWYARAMSSYGLLQGLTGARYDAIEKVLYLKPSIKGDFRSFICTAAGYGTVGLKNGTPFIDVKQGSIPVKRIEYSAN
ncbi:MAG: GH116 family glycosyl hydrolase [Planctomycetota bacterium]